MSVEVVMPQMGESITEGTVSKWLKAVGDKIDKDEPILEISTDKVDAEVPSPGAGVLLEIRHQEGETVEVGTVVAVIGQEGEQPADGGQPGGGQQEEAPTPEILANAASASINSASNQAVAYSDQSPASEAPKPQTSEAIEVVMPQMGESITEGTVSKWLKAVGDRVEKDEALLEISTDKVDAEVPSPAAGTVLEIKVREGETVEVGAVVARVGAEGAAPAQSPNSTDQGQDHTAAKPEPAAPTAVEAPRAEPVR